MKLRTMKKIIVSCFAVLSLASMVCFGQENMNPLREEILLAKTVFLTGGTPDLLDKATLELNKWGRFQIVASRTQADVVFDFGLHWQPGQGALETLAITDARTGETLYWADRVGYFAPWSHIQRGLLQDLRWRIEATESARTLEYTIQFETRAAKYFSDAATVNEKVVEAASRAPENSWKSRAMEWRKFADQLSTSKSEMTKFLARATVIDLTNKRNTESAKKYLDEILAYTCATVKANRAVEQKAEELRSSLSPDFLQILDAEKDDAGALDADCSSEQPKPPGN